ncbi:MAG: potassium channel family protein [Planctomycetota bacterium]
MRLRARTLAVLEPAADGDRLSRGVDLFLVALIVANVTAVVLETVPEVEARHGAALATFEVVSLAVFGLEYALRLWCCTAAPGHAHPLGGRLRWALRPMMLIDLLAILPGLLLLTTLDLRMLRALRLLRLLRLLKLTRHSAALQMFGRILRSRAPELASTLFVMLLLLVMASSLMYVLERDSNPAFSSIPTAMWWGIATFTTVGYGDLTPITPAGRLLGGFVAILGIAMFAIPAGLLGAAFSEELQEQRRKKERDAAAP